MNANLEHKYSNKILIIGHVLLRYGTVSSYKILHKERHTINSFDNGLYVYNQNCAYAKIYFENLLAVQ